VSILDFFGDFVFLEHRRNGQTGIKTIFDHFRNTHARYTEEIEEKLKQRVFPSISAFFHANSHKLFTKDVPSI
jgi:hypothetical protein